MASATGTAGLQIEFDPERQSIKAARDAVGSYAARVGADRPVVELAVSEAATNVVLHAHRGVAPRPFEVSARVDERSLQVGVCDHGVGMSPNPDSSGMGLGLSIIGNLADHVEIGCSEPGVHLCMHFPLSPARFEVPGPEIVPEPDPTPIPEPTPDPVPEPTPDPVPDPLPGPDRDVPEPYPPSPAA
ncbi:MAG: ATP-binding protein [Solirubrobacterales bacterium]